MAKALKIVGIVALILLLIAGLVSVVTETSDEYDAGRTTNPKVVVDTVDGCEYVIYARGGITHKGNCSNPNH